MTRNVWGLALAALVSACAGRESVVERAQQAGLAPQVIRTPGFDLAAWARLPVVPGGRLTVYIEGDGLAWLSRGRPSSDPTPRDPVALALATADDSPAVLYLARPCQFAGRADPRCEVRYWTQARFAPEVVESAAWAIDWAMRRSQARTLLLVGYSGGGTLAALLAARHPAAHTELTTIAAPLDLDRWTGMLGVSALSGSLSPTSLRTELQSVPQLHLAGGRDQTVPPALSRHWVDTLGGQCATLVVLPENDHSCCWAQLPRTMLAPPSCP